ncbi:hypothetical protein ACFL6C_02395 [Myxococcota bacterium]
MRAVAISALVLTFVVPIPTQIMDGASLTTAAAKRRRKPKPRKPTPPPTATPIKRGPGKTPDKAGLDPETSTTKLHEKAQALYDALEYEAVIPVTEAVLARKDATIEMRLDAYLLQGSSLAIVGDPIEAEKPFRFLLRGRPDYDMAAETPPKILAVFRKVQVEERTIVQQMHELERARIIRELQLEADVPAEATGGLPLVFSYRLRDPGRAVQSMNVHYRRTAAEPFSALALQIDDSGSWQGELPGEWTENDDGFTLQYFVTTQDAAGSELVSVGGATSPLNLQVEAGTVAGARPIYTSEWFWIAAAGVAVAAGIGGWVLYDQATELPQTDGFIDLSE